METLQLNLKKKWFDMIKSGDKTEEYIEIKTYWASRIVDFKTMHHHDINEIYENLVGYPEDGAEDIENLWNANLIQSKPFVTVTFSNGMTPPVPRFEIELLGIEIRTGKPEWGAEEGTKYFVIKLGSLINT